MSKAAPGLLFLLVGVAMLGALTLIPLWNATRMLNDGIFMYFMGDAVPGAIVIFSLAVVLLYVFVVAALCVRPSREFAGEQNALLVVGFFISLLAFGLMFASWPILWAGQSFSNKVFTNCAAPGPTLDLSRTWQKLHALRQEPQCRENPSVQACVGFQESMETSMLQSLEEKLQCSGWCHSTQAALDPGIVRGFAAEQDAEAFPATLFSRANFQATCDGMAARSMQITLRDTADELFYEGIALMFVFVGAGFLTVSTSTREAQGAKQRALESQDSFYGST